MLLVAVAIIAVLVAVFTLQNTQAVTVTLVAWRIAEVPLAAVALFAFALYLALKSKLVDFIQNVDHGIYFYATAAFLAGFSERRAKVLLDSAAGESDSDTSGGRKKTTK